MTMENKKSPDTGPYEVEMAETKAVTSLAESTLGKEEQ